MAFHVSFLMICSLKRTIQAEIFLCQCCSNVNADKQLSLVAFEY